MKNAHVSTIQLVLFLAAALAAPAAALADGSGVSGGTGATSQAFQACVNRLTAGVYTNAFGDRLVHDDTTLYPRYSTDVAFRFCGQNLARWEKALKCMNNLTAGVDSNSYGYRFVHDDTSMYPRYSVEDSLKLCYSAGDGWRSAKDCLDGMTAGVGTNSLGARFTTDASTHPRYPVSLSLPGCTYAGQPDKQACVTALVAAGVGEGASGALCSSNPSAQAQQCLLNFKLQGLGVLGPSDEYSAARLCAQNPGAQPADFSQLQRCLSAGSTGQVVYNGITPPNPPAPAGGSPSNGSPASGSGGLPSPHL